MNKNYREWGNASSDTAFQNKLDQLRNLHDLELLNARFGHLSVVKSPQLEPPANPVTPNPDAPAPAPAATSVMARLNVRAASKLKQPQPSFPLDTSLPLDQESLLYNRSHFDYTLEYETTRALRYHRHLSVCLVRIDNLEHLRASLHGQEISRLIFSLGGILKDALRGMDIPARYNENSFAIVLPETNTPGVMAVAGRILKAFKTTLAKSNEFAAHKLENSLSLGCACFPSHAKTAIGLMDSAQKSLEQAASNGGGMVCIL